MIWNRDKCNGLICPRHVKVYIYWYGWVESATSRLISHHRNRASTCQHQNIIYR